MEGILHLNESLIIGKGTERLCYRHPTDPRLCIKITHNYNKKKQQNVRDYIYYKQLEKRDIEWDHLPRCHGWIKTTFGTGLTFDLLQDAQGNPLPSITQLMKTQQIELSELEEPLNQLRAYLKRNIIFTSDLRDNNIVCATKKGKPFRLHLIDGLGDHDYVKLAATLPLLGRAKVDRQWKKFMQRMGKYK